MMRTALIGATGQLGTAPFRSVVNGPRDLRVANDIAVAGGYR